MKLSAIGSVWIGSLALGLALGAGCAPHKPITERDRKEAAHLVSEAQFAVTMREWARAEALLVKAVSVAPLADYWISLGAVRVRLNNRPGAQAAYESALKALEREAALNATAVEPWIKQAYVLALLGRRNESRAVSAKAARIFPHDVKVRALAEPREFERMVSSPAFKEMAL